MAYGARNDTVDTHSAVQERTGRSPAPVHEHRQTTGTRGMYLSHRQAKTTTGNRFGLEVNRTKTEVQCIGREKQQMKTSLGGTELTQCDEFVYMGGVVSADGLCDRDVDRRIGLAAGIVRNLHSIWKAKDISKSTKVLYQSMVQSIVLYNSETWTIKEDQKRKLNTFEMAVLRKICGITRRDRRRNVDILKELQIEKE